ncbi:MAG: MBL fold metallo-hydrolase [Eubacteriales bacterium]
MQLKYYGTAAAEAWQALFCHCECCKKAAAAGGRNIRTRSQAAVDGKLLIDFPPDTYMHVINYGLNLKEITSLIITHGHSDHFYPDDIENICPVYAHIYDDRKLKIFAPKPVIDRLRFIENREVKRVVLTEIEHFVPFQTDGYTITPLTADHDRNEKAVFYVISDGTRTMLYGNDTGYFDEAVWDYLSANKIKFDLVSLDCTGIIDKGRHWHMSLSSNKEVIDRLSNMGAISAQTKRIAHHFSHNGLLTYDELVPVAAEQGMLVSYDGMEIEV